MISISFVRQLTGTRSLTAALFLLFLLCGAGTATAQYCSPTYLPTGTWTGQPACGSNGTFPAGHAITNVSIGTINNPVPTANCTISDYTALSTTVIAAGICQPTPLSVTTTGFCGVSVAVDLNNDLDFADPGEIVILSQYIAANPAVYNLSLAIPVGTTPGPHRMRIYNSGANSGADAGACGVYQFGNFQDYLLNIVADPNAGLVIATESITICSDALPYTWNGKVITAGGTAVDSVRMPNAAGCDSLTYLDLTVHPVVTVTEPKTICLSDLPLLWNGITVVAGGPAAATYVTLSAAGCDSTTILDLTVHPEASVTQDIGVCEADLPFSWNGFTLSAGGNAVATYVTPSTWTGCDSTTILNLTVNVAADIVEHVTICNRESYFFDGRNYTTKQRLYKMFKTAGGCDSAVTINLDVVSCCDKTMLAPTSFTPNTDGLNDTWSVLVAEESKVSLVRIWNRWGQLVYTSINTPWDGTVKGVPAEQGTYFFEVNGTCKDGTPLHKKGDLLLIR